MSDASTQRDHLFISYAGEDGALAEWLTLKLTAEGYNVWCDRVKLRGGESYPTDIDKAIKNDTFRMLALLSRHSIHKPNPKKERTLGLNIAKERGVDFLVPLNVDGLSPTELDWMTSDITFIPFHQSWAEGFAGLLRKLESIEAPMNLDRGRPTVCHWFAACDSAASREERLWTNILPMIEIPSTICQVYLEGQPDLDALGDNWAFFRQNRNTVWAFVPPDGNIGLAAVERSRVDWRKSRKLYGVDSAHILMRLLRESFRVYSLRKGLRPVPGRPHVFFPRGLLANNRLSFTNYKGQRTHVDVVGYRTVRSVRGQTESRQRVWYHLTPVFRPVLRGFGDPIVLVRVRLHFTDNDGNPMQAGRALRLRKKICKGWWNHEWLNRVMAVSHWLTDGRDRCDIVTSAAGNFTISGRLLSATMPFGIDEEALEQLAGPDEGEILDETAEDVHMAEHEQAEGLGHAQ